jgi:hypothetical protein
MEDKMLHGFAVWEVSVIRSIVTDFVFFKSDPRGEYDIYEKLVDDLRDDALMRRFAFIVVDEVSIKSEVLEYTENELVEPENSHSIMFLYYLIAKTLKKLDVEKRSVFVAHVIDVFETNRPK